MDPAELERLRRSTGLFHGGLLVVLVALRPLVWDGDPASPANLIYLALIVIACAVTAVEVLAGGRRTLRWSWTGLVFTALVVALIPAALAAPAPSDGAAWWWQLVLHLALGGYLMQVVPGRERIAWSALVAGLAGEVAIGWVQGLYVLPQMAAATGAGDAGSAAEGVAAGDLAERIARGGWFGTFTLSNTCAAWLLVAAVPLIGVARRSWPAALLALAAGGLFLATRSKGALVAVAAAAGLWWMIRQPGWRRWLPLPLAGLAAAALLIPAVQDGLAASARVRLGYWSGAVELVGERPWIGHGWGTFAERASGVLPMWAEPSRLVHNEPLELAVVAGVPLAALLVLLLVAVARPRRTDDALFDDGERPHPSAAIGLALVTSYCCLLGMLDGNLGWWPGGGTPFGQGAWGLLLGAGLALLLLLAARVPLPPRWWLRFGLTALAIHCLVDFNLHSFAVVGTLLTVAVLAGSPARELPVGRPVGALLLVGTALLAAGALLWAATAIDLRATGDLVRSLRLAREPAHAEEGFASIAFILGVELPPPGDRRGRVALFGEAVESAWNGAAADPSLQLTVIGFAPPSAERLARLDGLRLRLPWSAGVARLRADDLAAAGKWQEAIDEQRRATLLAPANLPIRQELEALLARAAEARPADAERWRVERAEVQRVRQELEPVVDYRNRAR